MVVGVQWAHVSTAGIDKFSRILVDASDLWQDIEALVNTSSDTTVAYILHMVYRVETLIQIGVI